jgi:hypothetical protein
MSIRNLAWNRQVLSAIRFLLAHLFGLVAILFHAADHRPLPWEDRQGRRDAIGCGSLPYVFLAVLGIGTYLIRRCSRFGSASSASASQLLPDRLLSDLRYRYFCTSWLQSRPLHLPAILGGISCFRSLMAVQWIAPGFSRLDNAITRSGSAGEPGRLFAGRRCVERGQYGERAWRNPEPGSL